MKKRHFQVRVVKDDEVPPKNETFDTETKEALLAQAGEVAKGVMREGTRMIVGYVVVDTVRKIAIARSTR